MGDELSMEEADKLNEAVLSAKRADEEAQSPWLAESDEAPPWTVKTEKEEKKEEEAAPGGGDSSWWGNSWWDSSWSSSSWHGWGGWGGWGSSWHDWGESWPQWGKGRGTGTGWLDFVPDSNQASESSWTEEEDPPWAAGQEE